MEREERVERECWRERVERERERGQRADSGRTAGGQREDSGRTAADSGWTAGGQHG